MSTKNELIKKKAFGLISSIDKMNEIQKRGVATKDYGDDINQLLALARKENPDLVDLIPSDLKFTHYQYEGLVVSTPWHEIHSKLNALISLLSNED